MTHSSTYPTAFRPSIENRRNKARNNLLNIAFNACHALESESPRGSTEIGPPADRELPETDVSFDTTPGNFNRVDFVLKALMDRRNLEFDLLNKQHQLCDRSETPLK